MNIVYINRKTGHKEVEKVYKNGALTFLYGDRWFSRQMGKTILPLVAKFPFFSQAYGFLQKQSISQKKIHSFINHFNIDSTEFLESVDHFKCFNDFFIRQLKKEARPIDEEAEKAIIPADGRYYFYQNIDLVKGFVVKDKKFNLATLLDSEELAASYSGGSMVIARLCPSDYHRFHFPCDGLPGPSHLINGWLYSVNPIAIRKNLDIFTQNKRSVCAIDTPLFGSLLFVEVGATCVGSIKQTYQAGQKYLKGDEKGYFEFGGSCLILLFPKNSIEFDTDLISATEAGLEVRCLMGESMGRVNKKK